MNKILFEDLNDVANTINNLDIKNKTFLITGANGTLGKFLTNCILTSNQINSTNNRIITITRNKLKTSELFISSNNIIHKDYSDEIEESIDYIVHFASPTNSRFFVEHAQETYDCIVNLTEKFLKLTTQKKAKIIYVSSMESYGLVTDNNPKNEDELGYINSSSPRSSYPLGKRNAELLCQKYYRENQTKAVVARLAQTFGAGSDVNDTRLFSYCANCVFNNKDIVLSTDGQSYGNYVYLSDAIKAILYLIKYAKDGEIFNVAGLDSNIKILDFCTLIADNKVKVVCNIGKNYYPENTKLNMSIDKIKGIGWKPSFKLENTIQRYKEYLNLELNNK